MVKTACVCEGIIRVDKITCCIYINGRRCTQERKITIRIIHELVRAVIIIIGRYKYSQTREIAFSNGIFHCQYSFHIAIAHLQGIGRIAVPGDGHMVQGGVTANGQRHRIGVYIGNEHIFIGRCGSCTRTGIDIHTAVG